MEGGGAAEAHNRWWCNFYMIGGHGHPKNRWLKITRIINQLNPVGSTSKTIQVTWHEGAEHAMKPNIVGT